MKFRRQDSHKKARLASSWRKPRGRQSKMRLKKRGYARPISVGYGSPKATRGKVKGLDPIVVSTLAELTALDAKTQAAVFAKSIGARKREGMLKAAKEKNITILNIDVEKALKTIADGLAARKKDKEAREAKKKEKKTLDEKVKKEEKEEELSDEEKKEIAEEEKRKVLTQKQ